MTHLRQKTKAKPQEEVVHDPNAKVLIPIAHIPRRQLTNLIPVDYKGMSPKKCIRARIGYSYAKLKTATDSRLHDIIQ